MDTWITVLSGRRREILVKNTGVPRGDPKQSQRRSLGTSAALFPVAQCMDTDPESVGELLLRQSNKPAQRMSWVKAWHGISGRTGVFFFEFVSRCADDATVAPTGRSVA